MSTQTSFSSIDSSSHFFPNEAKQAKFNEEESTSAAAAVAVAAAAPSSVNSSSIKLHSSSAQPSKHQYQNTSGNSMPLTITPVSASARSSFSSPRGPNSKSSPPSPTDVSGLENSELDSLPPLALPRSSMAPATPPITTADNGALGRNQGLIRRLSRGASNRLRGRPSASNIRSRDQSFGSVRRRSDSRSVTTDGAYEISDLDLDSDEEVLHSEIASPITPDASSSSFFQRPPIFPSILSRRSSTKTPSFPFSEGVLFNKVTKKKNKALRLFLDRESAKIHWSTKQIYVDDIKDIRIGPKVQGYMEEVLAPDDWIDRWVTIVYSDSDKSKGRATKIMHLVAEDRDTKDSWVSSLRHLIRKRYVRMARIADNRDTPLYNHWKREMARKGAGVDEEEDQWMDFAAIKRTCRSFSINKSDQILRAQFDAIDVERTGKLTETRYMDFFRLLMERKDIRNIYEQAKSPNESTLSLERFLNFLQTYQDVDVFANRELWSRTFSEFVYSKRRGTSQTTTPSSTTASHEETFSTPGMSVEAFRDFLLSDANSVVAKVRPERVSLDRPLNEYFISSSHNTYLRGRQVGGESSPEAYTEALQRGCRCVEIDCWDGEDGKPRVTHGRTLTSAVSFLDCIKAINASAFVVSEYPLIISLEVHCNPEQQRVMADMMKETFGDKLLLQPILPHAYILPSPELLKHKIIIKVKEPRIDPANATNPMSSLANKPSISTTTVAHRRQRSISAPDPRVVRTGINSSGRMPSQVMSPIIGPSQHSGPGMAAFQNPRVSGPLFGNNISSVSNTSSDDSDADVDYSSRPKSKRPKQSNIVEALGNLGIYTRGIKFLDWKAPQSKTYNHIFSFNENTFQSKCKTPESKTALERHNVGHLMRVYPRGSRVNSSNFDPIQFWRRGVQMAATNWQTHDLGTQINNAMFAAGIDQTGYVLKPEELRRVKDTTSNHSNGERVKLQRKEVKFSVEIISAQWLALPSKTRPDTVLHPYVVFEMYSAEDKGVGVASGEGGIDASDRSGMSGIGSPLRKRTCIVEGNGFDPVFNEEITMTLYTKYPSLVFVRWAVWNSPDGRQWSNAKEPIAMFTAKLDSLQQGYRRLRLVNNIGEELHSSLFCRIKKESHRDVDSPNPLTPTLASLNVERHHANGSIVNNPPQNPMNGNVANNMTKKSIDQPRASAEEPAATVPPSTVAVASSPSSPKPGKDFLRRVFSRSGSDRKQRSGARDQQAGAAGTGGGTEAVTSSAAANERNGTRKFSFDK